MSGKTPLMGHKQLKVPFNLHYNIFRAVDRIICLSLPSVYLILCNIAYVLKTIQFVCPRVFLLSALYVDLMSHIQS